MNSNRRYSSLTPISSPQSSQVSQRNFSKNKIFSEKESSQISMIPISTQPLKSICNVFKKDQVVEFMHEESVQITQQDIQQSQVSECGVQDLPQRPHESFCSNKQLLGINNCFKDSSNIKTKILKKSKLIKSEKETQVNFIQEVMLNELEKFRDQLQEYENQIKEKDEIIKKQQYEIEELQKKVYQNPIEQTLTNEQIENKMEFSFRKDSVNNSDQLPPAQSSSNGAQIFDKCSDSMNQQGFIQKENKHHQINIDPKQQQHVSYCLYSILSHSNSHKHQYNNPSNLILMQQHQIEHLSQGQLLITIIIILQILIMFNNNNLFQILE